ncbi:M28 family peptidase [Oscillatoria sp. FACHB-1407]
MSGKRHRPPLINRAAIARLAVIGITILVAIAAIWLLLLRMPGQSYRGELTPLSQSAIVLRDRLRQEVTRLATDIGHRNALNPQRLTQSTEFLTEALTEAGYTVRLQDYQIDGQPFYNLEVERLGTQHPDEIVVVGAHFDTAFTSPGANDNGTGAAATVELARLFAQTQPDRTLRFVEFVNEEPPFFWTEQMGSRVYAQRCRDRGENIVAMLSLETMGYYSTADNSQKYPFPLNLVYPSQGNFIAFIGNIPSRQLVRRAIASFRQHAQFPSEGAALPAFLPGVGWSDHWAFWQSGYPAVMVTDTAPFRYPYYHTDFDTPDQIDYDRLTRVVLGLQQVIADLLK